MQHSETVCELSVTTLPVLGGENGGKVYRLNEKEIVKEYTTIKTLKEAEKLYSFNNELSKWGVPVSAAKKVVRTENGYGIVYDYIDGKSIGSLINKNPEKLNDYARRMGDLLKKMHQTDVLDGGLVDIKDRLLAQIDRLFELGYTNSNNRELLILFLKQLPNDNKVLHCDFHEGNVLVQNEELKIIDTDEVCSGSPIFDLAFFFQSEYLVFFTPKICRDSHKLGPRYVHNIYYSVLQEYWGGIDKKTIKKNMWELRYLIMLLLALNPVRLEEADMINNRKALKFVMCRAIAVFVFFIKRKMIRTIAPKKGSE